MSAPSGAGFAPGDHARHQREAVRAAFDRASGRYDAHAVLQARVRGELLERLELLAFAPATILDLGAGTGHASRALCERYPRARVIAIDLAPRMLAEARARQTWRRRFERVRADAARLPLADATVELVFSNLMLPWTPDLTALFAELRRVLAPRGCLSFSTLGPATLRELRAARRSLAAEDGLPRLPDLPELGAALAEAGFADQVLDVDHYTLSYSSVRALGADLRAAGARALTPRNELSTHSGAGLGGLAGRADLARLAAAYEAFRAADGRLPATCEVVYGQAWCPGERAPIRSRRGEFAIDVGVIGRRG